MQIESFAYKFKRSIEMVEKKKATSDLDEFDVAQQKRLEIVKDQRKEMLKLKDTYEYAEQKDFEFF